MRLIDKNKTFSGTMIVTGGGKRLGHMIAEKFAEKGWKIILHFNNSEKEANILKKKIINAGGKIELIKKELSDYNSAKEIIDFAFEKSFLDNNHNDYFVLINNASAFLYDTGIDLSEERLNTHLKANFIIPTFLIKEFAAKTQNALNSSVVNMLDSKLFGLNPDHYSYTLSKYALLGLTKIAALSYAPLIRVNAIAPGITLPNPEQSDKEFNRIHKLNPLKQGSTPEEIYKAIDLLITSKSITGETILIDGGAHLQPQYRDAKFL